MQVNYKKVFFFTFLYRGLFSLYVCEIGMKPRDLFAVLKFIFIELQAKNVQFSLKNTQYRGICRFAFAL